jgi:DNA polymerase III beta subunit, central domain
MKHAFVMRLDQFLRVSKFISKDETRPYLMGVRIEKPSKGGGANCIATDGHRLGVLNCPDAILNHAATWRVPKELKLRPKKQAQPWVVGSLTESSGYISIVEWCADDTPKDVLIRVEDCSVRYGNCIVAGEYPNWKRLIPEISNTSSTTALNGNYASSFGDYVNITGNGDSFSPKAITIPGEPEFFGILMPMRPDAPKALPKWMVNGK